MANQEADTQSQSKLINSDNLTKWLSTAFALITAGLGTKDVLYQKLVLPYAQPININVLAEVSEINPPKLNVQNTTRQVNIRTTVKNLGQSKVYFLMPHWIIYGHMKGQEANESFYLSSRDLADKINKALEPINNSLRRIEVTTQTPDHKNNIQANKNKSNVKDFLGIGPLFNETNLYPQSEFKDNRVVIIPNNKQMTYLEVKVNIPTLAQSSILETKSRIRWVGKALSLSEDESYAWYNYYCEDLPFDAKNPKLISHEELLNIYTIKNYTKKNKEPPPIYTPDDQYCTLTTLGLSSDEAAKIGARVITVTQEVPLDVK
jgi:hypothetical protein